MNIAIVQAPLEWGNVTGNLMAFDGRLLKIDNADMIVLPEMFASGFMMEGKEKIASRYDEICQRMQVWASNKQAVVLGSTVFHVSKYFFNRLLAVFPDGKIFTYDKRHCFTMGGERKHFMPGEQLLIFDYHGVRVSPFICYDLRFPVWSRNTCGYDIAVYVANWPQVRRNVWQTLLKARAIENQCYVVGVNRVGEDKKKLSYSGDSALISPKGEVVASCAPYADEVCQVDIDIESLREFRRQFPVLEDMERFKIMKNRNKTKRE